MRLRARINVTDARFHAYPHFPLVFLAFKHIIFYSFRIQPRPPFPLFFAIIFVLNPLSSYLRSTCLPLRGFGRLFTPGR